MNYNYYDTPEGEDCFLKLWYTSRVSGLTALGVSVVDVMFFSHPKGYLETLSRFGYFTFPLVGMAAAFTATTCAATNLRRKDDKLNYALGGVAAGCIYGTWQKTIKSGFVTSVLFGAFAMLKKASKEDRVGVHARDQVQREVPARLDAEEAPSRELGGLRG
uniref:NADH dehydrogenase [ubiquinone] 1 alpha subcomplex subunit 11 n=1 Tax=Timema californicum TaxID=61474 RepID=A0A7R9PDP8_TIMCA|nr:unnamed protein product [Timema californicum]